MSLFINTPCPIASLENTEQDILKISCPVQEVKDMEHSQDTCDVLVPSNDILGRSQPY